jgi:hypothetical protein
MRLTKPRTAAPIDKPAPACRMQCDGGQQSPHVVTVLDVQI